MLVVGPLVMADALFYSLHATVGAAVRFRQPQVKSYFTGRSVAWRELDFDITEVLPIPSCVPLGGLINLSKLRFPYLYSESDKILLM